MASQQLCFVNGLIYTPDGLMDWLQISGNRILATGQGIPPACDTIIDLDGNLVLPGLHDTHIHVSGIGRQSMRLDLRNVGSIAEMKTRLELYIQENAPTIVVGHGWDQDYMEDKRYPSRDDIDDITSIPVILFRNCNHIALLNTAALKIAGITASTTPPLGGSIDLDVSGELTGIIRENALDLVRPLIHNTEEHIKSQFFKIGIDTCLQYGLTSVHTNDANAWQAYRSLTIEGELPIRVFLTGYLNELEQLPSPGSKEGLLVMKRIKLFADGSLGAETALLREPYAGSDQKGMAIYSPQELHTHVKTIHAHGYQVETHAIGDGAVEMVLDAYEKAGLDRDDRAIITHCQIMGADLADRMAKHGYIANIQPSFVPTDSVWVSDRLGSEGRLTYAYAWKRLIDHGVTCAGGSDAPIESADPFYGIYCAMVRPDHRGNTWRQEECLNFDEALALYTQNAAYAIGMENTLGVLQSGYLADFVIVNPNIMENPRHLLEQPVREVWVDGKLRYRS